MQTICQQVVTVELTQNDGHYTVEGHRSRHFQHQSKARMDFLCVNNSNLYLISYRFQDIAD